MNRPYRFETTTTCATVAVPTGRWKRCLDSSDMTRALLERKFDSFFFFASYEFVSLNDAGASVPPKNRIVVTWRAERFSFFEPIHCLTQKIVCLKPAAGRVLPQFRLCPTFGDDSGIVRALIFLFDAA